MEAGHFDTKTAYAAANTLRLDDMNPHFWRTHDGGKTWTEIDNGIAGGAVANSIREDPRKKGLLYAATDTQVWVSFDDGDNWHSLRLNMPAISVRDIEVKDDASCMCSDLVAGTHGRGFWILDDVTPLRQAAEAAAAIQRVSVQAGDRHPHSLRHQRSDAVAAGIAGRGKSAARRHRRLLPAGRRCGEVKLEFLDGQGKVIRTYSSSDPVRSPDPATDPVAYNKLCQQTPTAPDCNLPLYWPAPPQVLKTIGRHASLQLGPALRSASGGGGGGGRGGGGGGGAVPHRTYPGVNSPWVAPGTYSVRLTANGQSQTQPITVKMDPRVKITPEVQQIFTLTTQMENGAQERRRRLQRGSRTGGEAQGAPAIGGQRRAASSRSRNSRRRKRPAAGRRWRAGAGGRWWWLWRLRRNRPALPNLGNIGAQMVGAAMGMQGSEMPPTAAQIQACRQQQAAYAALMAKWAALKAKVNGGSK